MTPYLEYEDKRCLELTLRFSPYQEFRQVVDTVRSVRLPSIFINGELAAFAVLELLSNSIRAHRERLVSDAIELNYCIRADRLEIEILDAGRGFDPNRLPYRLENPLDQVDPQSAAFAEYRLSYGNGRFGMGLLAARRTFPSFSLSFIDREQKPCVWYSGLVRGTRVLLAAPLEIGAPRRDDGAELEELLAVKEEA